MATQQTNGGTALLSKLRETAKLQLMPIYKLVQRGFFGGGMDDALCNYTIFAEALYELKLTPEDITKAIEEYTTNDPAADRAVGAMMGQAIGDAFGAPLEFLDADERPWPQNIDEAKATKRDSFMLPFINPKTGKIVYANTCNKFQLLQGQWTDDASMALCLADNMIVNGTYEGGDCRARYFNWWYHGYNNAFRMDESRHYGRTSVGLGGNISKSIDDLLPSVGKSGTKIEGRFAATGEDAGNGSIMRLSPVPVRYHSDVFEAMKQAAESSYATHPGPDAAACCRFISYFVVNAIHRKPEDPAEMKTFLTKTIDDFSALYEGGKLEKDSGMDKLMALLKSAPPSEKEQCWNWRNPGQLEIAKTLKARGRKFNGYPVIPGYFGSYCMDGLAMSLWAMDRSTDFTNTMFNVINLLGDCDTTAAIAGQMVGAFYGFNAMKTGELGAHMAKEIHHWDPEHQWELRALWLYEDGNRPAAAAPASSE